MKASRKPAKPKGRSKFHGRISIDFPPELYEELKSTVTKNEQTLKSFIVDLVAKDFDFDLDK